MMNRHLPTGEEKGFKVKFYVYNANSHSDYLVEKSFPTLQLAQAFKSEAQVAATRQDSEAWLVRNTGIFGHFLSTEVQIVSYEYRYVENVIEEI